MSVARALQIMMAVRIGAAVLIIALLPEQVTRWQVAGSFLLYGMVSVMAAMVVGTMQPPTTQKGDA